MDPGKFKTVCCVMDAVTRDVTFDTVQTSPASLHELLVKHLTPSASDTLVVFETCDPAGWVHDLCQGLGVAAIVTHANGEAWQWRRVKRKTDRDDALKLAKPALLDQLGPAHMPSPDQRQRLCRAGMRFRGRRAIRRMPPASIVRASAVPCSRHYRLFSSWLVQWNTVSFSHHRRERIGYRDQSRSGGGVYAAIRSVLRAVFRRFRQLRAMAGRQRASGIAQLRRPSVHQYEPS